MALGDCQFIACVVIKPSVFHMVGISFFICCVWGNDKEMNYDKNDNNPTKLSSLSKIPRETEKWNWLPEEKV